jgi:hypothetical protein
MSPSIPGAVPFSSAEEAWLWTMAALDDRARGWRGGASGPPRPCEPDDVVMQLDRLFRRYVITREDAAVLAKWGKRRQPPDPRARSAWRDAALWQDALARLEPLLVERGIVRAPGAP